MRRHILPHFIGCAGQADFPGVYNELEVFEKAPKYRNLFWKISNVGIIESCGDRRQVVILDELHQLIAPVTAITRHVVRST